MAPPHLQDEEEQLLPEIQPPSHNLSQHFDVIVVGGGYGGQCQVRHLLLKRPDLRVALVDPKDENDRSLKVGESQIEVATMFVNYELKLYEYMIDNHPPKFGLNYHWPKDSSKTESLQDYFHVFANRNPQIQSYHMKVSNENAISSIRFDFNFLFTKNSYSVPSSKKIY
jgi:hypothetical protein